VRLKGKPGISGRRARRRAGEDRGPVVARRWSDEEERKGGDRCRQVGSAGQREGGRESAGWLEAGRAEQATCGRGKGNGPPGKREPAQGKEEKQAGLAGLVCPLPNLFLFTFLICKLKSLFIQNKF
jgi:hypothetical protein